MLEKIIIENFKSIKDNQNLKLNKLTLISGANSSGKSSILQTILTLSQSFTSRHEHNSIALNGNVLRLGSIYDIKSHSRRDDPITLGFQYKNNSTTQKNASYKTINVTTNFNLTKNTTNSSDDEFHPSIDIINLTTTRENGLKEELSCKKKPYRELETINEFNIEKYSFEDDLHLQETYPEYEIISCEPGAIIPYLFNIRFNKAKKIYRDIYSSLKTKNNIDIDSIRLTTDDINTEIPFKFFEKINDFSIQEVDKKIDQLKKSVDFSKFISKEAKKQLPKNTRFSKDIFWETLTKEFKNKTTVLDLDLFREKFTINDWITHLNSINDEDKTKLKSILDLQKDVLEELWIKKFPTPCINHQLNISSLNHISNTLTTYFLKSIKYLGPLRTEPQAIYPSLGNLESNNIGFKGEYTAAVLHINAGRIIKYISPKLDEKNKIFFEEKKETLVNACNDWLKYLGVLHSYKTKDKGKLGYELAVKINANDNWQDLTHVGVGVSQILPIVLMSLLSQSDDVLIFEQPELHLHPKVQSRLCDLFLSLTKNNRQCLIETHSEYLIHRLRLRIAQSPSNEIKENTSIYFFEKSNDTSKIQEVEINEYGAILNWPDDFFDQSDNEIEKILIEASKKSKASNQL